MTQMPHGEPGIPTLMHMIRELQRDVLALQMSQGENEPDDDSEFYEAEIAFSCPGSPVTQVTSPVYHVRWPVAYITEVRINFGSVPSGMTTSLDVLVNGSVKTQVPFSEGSEGGPSTVTDDVMIEVEEWDRIAVRLGQVPAAVSDVTVQVIVQIPVRGA